MRSVYLSHDTALRFWREWSIDRAIPLRDFHKCAARTTRDLPARTFPSSSVIRSSLATRSSIVELLGRILRETPDGAPVRALRAILDGSAIFGNPADSSTAFAPFEAPLSPRGLEGGKELGTPVHIVGPRKPGIGRMRGIVYHHSSAAYPRDSFLEVASGVYVSAPELVFVQMAESLSFGALLALGYELCGCYSASSVHASVRHPLCSAERLRAYASRLSDAKGVRLARKVSRQVKPRSASPAETELAAVVSTSRVFGGLGLDKVALNEPVALPRSGQRIAHADTLICDVVWPDERIVLEYDSSAHHTDAAQIARDARRRGGLAAAGFSVRSVTASQFAEALGFQEMVRQAFRESGRYVRKLDAKQMARHMRLRYELRKWRG